jgi:phosphopantothenoylcysteine decarboxylase/phosphopantothenate--cysteine ligase
MTKRKPKTRNETPTPGDLAGLRILLGVTGGIAAYKAAYLLRLLRKAGAETRVMMTRNALRFVGEVTFETLSGHPVATDVFGRTEGREGGVYHINWADWPDYAVVAPATANCLGKLACGIADDLTSTLLLALPCPLLLAPAMNDVMWNNPSVRGNVERLREQGRHLVEPGEGWLACERTGEGRMAEPEEILAALRGLLGRRPASGLRFLVTAGGTEEDIDPARCITNRSSGRMGFALAREARRQGAEVEIVAARTSVSPPEGIPLDRVRTSAEMEAALAERFPGCDVLVMAAAVSDFRPRTTSPEKIRRLEKGSMDLSLEAVPDLLASVSAHKDGRTVVGFALETGGSLVESVRRKLESKGVDLMVGNDPTVPGAGFETETNRIVMVDRDGDTRETEVLPKDEVARVVVTRALELHRAAGGEREKVKA